MEPTLEAIKGGGGSIKVGTTGKISALMSRELESTKPSSILAGDTNPRRPKFKTDEPSSSHSKTSFKNQKGRENNRRTKHQSTHQIPMLKSGDVSVDGTPIRQKPVRRGPNVVEIVDIRCGNNDRNWVNPITDRLKKLGFSKLSESIV